MPTQDTRPACGGDASKWHNLKRARELHRNDARWCAHQMLTKRHAARRFEIPKRDVLAFPSYRIR
jgi:hypothetical protein